MQVEEALEQSGRVRGSPVARNACKSLFLMFSKTMVDSMSSHCVSGFILRIPLLTSDSCGCHLVSEWICIWLCACAYSLLLFFFLSSRLVESLCSCQFLVSFKTLTFFSFYTIFSSHHAPFSVNSLWHLSPPVFIPLSDCPAALVSEHFFSLFSHCPPYQHWDQRVLSLLLWREPPPPFSLLLVTPIRMVGDCGQRPLLAS